MHNPHWLRNLNIVISNEWPILHLYLKQSSLSMPLQPPMAWQPAALHYTKVLFFLHQCSFVRCLLTLHESSLPFSSDITIWIKNFKTNSFLPRSATHVSDEVQFHFPIPVNWLFYIVIFRLFTRRSEFKNLWRRSPNSTDSWFALLDISPHPERARRPYSE